MSLFETERSEALGTGRLSPDGSILDADLATLLLNYKRSVASRYIAATAPEIEDLTPRGDLHVSRKKDGQMWFAILDGKEAFLSNPKGKVISGDHPLVNELVSIAERVTDRTVIAGELYAEGTSDRARCGDIANAFGGGSKAAVERMRFMAFDLCLGDKDFDDGKTEGGTDPFAYAPRLAELERIFDGGKLATSVETEKVSGANAVRQLYQDWVAKGNEEGLVIRSDKQRPIKIKPDIHIDAVVIGYTVRREDPEQCSSVLLGLMREDGQFQELGSCGNLGEGEWRKELLTKLTPLDVASSYRRASSSGALYRFVRPSMVVEIKSTDVQAENASGDSIRRMVLNHDDDGGWSRLRKMPVASMLHPVFVRIREDKGVNETDIRMTQLDEHVYVRESSSKVEVLALEPSTVLRREVYTKASKGKTMVRKLVMWKSNKEQADSAFSPYVVHFTDYSAGRKDPLKREVRLAGTEAKASAIADAMLAKNIKKGWSLAEPG